MNAALLFAPSVLIVCALGCDATFDFRSTTAGITGDSGSAPVDAGSGDGGVGFAPPCFKDDDCPVSKLHCDIASGQCVECLGDRHCVVLRYPRCETTIERCVGCLSAADCKTDEYCDKDAHICIAQCSTAVDCTTSQPLCSDGGTCVECVTSAECGQHQVCDTYIGRCVGCIDEKQCEVPAPFCDLLNPEHTRCKECLSSSHCPADKPYCDLHGGICVALVGP